MKSRSKNFIDGALLAYLYQGSMMVVGLWLTPFYLRKLGAHNYGIWLVGLQVLNFLLLCDLGVLAVAPRDVAHAHGQELASGDSQPLRELFGRLFKTVVVQTLLVGCVAAGLFVFHPVSGSGLRGPIAVVLFFFVVTFPLRAANVILQGLQDLKFLGQLRLWLWSGAAALIVALLIAGAGFYALAIGWCLQEAGGSVISMFRLRHIRPDLCNLDAWRDAGRFRWAWLTRGLWVSLGQIATSLVGGSDFLIVARVFGPATVVIYSCTGKLVQVLQQQPQILASTALPGISQMKTSEGLDRIRKATTSLTQAMIFVAGAIVCVVLPLNEAFVQHWVGKSYFGGVALTALFLGNFLLRIIDYTLSMALFALGHERLYAIRALLEGVIGFSLAFVLGRTLGLEGVISGFLCAVLLIGIPIDLHRLAKDFEISILQAMKPYVPYFWRIGAVGAAAFLILRRVPIPNLFYLVVAGAAVGLAYLAVTFPYLRKSDLADYARTVMPDLPVLRFLGLSGRRAPAPAPQLGEEVLGEPAEVAAAMSDEAANNVGRLE